MKVSICMSTFNRPLLLDKTLASIFSQSVPFDMEVIVVDDGSPTGDVWKVLEDYPVVKCRIDREPSYRNPSVARNAAYRAARGEVIIAQSDDVIHTSGAIASLVTLLQPGTFLIASVYNVDSHFHGVDSPLYLFTGPGNQRPFFFLGSVYRKDVYAVGGNSEDFVAPSYDDEWFALCLTRGLGLRPVYSDSIIGYHQHHVHLGNDAELVRPSKELYESKVRDVESGISKWEALGGPWNWEESQ